MPPSVQAQEVVFSRIIAATLLTFGALPPAVQAEEYALDEVSRSTPTQGKLTCPEVGGLVRFRGKKVRYQGPITVNPHLTQRLLELENLIVEVAKKHYGRAPARIEHLGSYNCRRIRGWPGYLSEHGLANAVDISAFRFARAKRSERGGLAKHLRRGFRVSLLRHWNARGRDAVHACFLRDLAREVMSRDLFRGIFGPGYPGHANHFHFDMSPWVFREVDLSGGPLCKSLTP